MTASQAPVTLREMAEACIVAAQSGYLADAVEDRLLVAAALIHGRSSGESGFGSQLHRLRSEDGLSTTSFTDTELDALQTEIASEIVARRTNEIEDGIDEDVAGDDMLQRAADAIAWLRKERRPSANTTQITAQQAIAAVLEAHAYDTRVMRCKCLVYPEQKSSTMYGVSDWAEHVAAIICPDFAAPGERAG